MLIDNYLGDVSGNDMYEGDAVQQVGASRMDPGLFRPYRDERGKQCVRISTGRRVYNKATNQMVPERKKFETNYLRNRYGINFDVWNATSLRKDEWKLLDDAVLPATRDRLRAWSDLAATNPVRIDGMSHFSYEHEKRNDPMEAMMDMTGLAEGRTDQSRYQVEGLPLPITHADFHLPQRKLNVSRNKGMPLDTEQIESASQRVSEMVEKTVIGMAGTSPFAAGDRTGYTAAIGGRVWGYRNHPKRITKTDLTASASFDAETFVQEIIAMKELARAQKFYGPFMLYYSTSWDQYLERDYYVMTTQGAAAPTRTVRQRVMEIDGIRDARILDFYTSTDELLLVDMSPRTARAIIGMDIRPVMWPVKGGMQINFKVMGILVPDVRSQYIGPNTTSTEYAGIVHGTTS